VLSAAILIIGDEVLSGEVQDTNGPYLLQRLTGAGVRVPRVVTVPDEASSIVEELRRLRALADAVVLSGGIGPTHDDVTRPAVAQVLGLPLEAQPAVEERIRSFFGDRLTDADLGMARMPAGCRVLVGAKTGTFGFAAGGVYVLPGVPVLFRDLADGIVSEFSATPLLRHEIVTRRSEGEIAERLASCQGRAEDVRIGSYPVFESGGWHVRVVLRGADAGRLEAVAREVRAWIDPVA
jgi:molybdenum cofactor synthesis domain-containing protein